MKRAYIVFYFLLLIVFNGFGQGLEFSEVPENYRLYARDALDSALVSISGKVKKGFDFEALSFKVYKDGTLYDNQKIDLEDKNFSLSTKIDAGLHQFRFELSTHKNQKDSLYMVADSVVCGDAYIISGQSNSHASSSLSSYSSTYCRSFGVKTGFEAYNEADKKIRWGRATGNVPDLEGVGGWFTKNPYGVGVWGMELMKRILDEHQVPVCIINGGSGSSSIEQNMLYPEKPSLETGFGRLAYRVDQAGLKDKIKAIFWHQGETNSNFDKNYASYATNFEQLLTDWQRVYGGLRKVYIFQLHPGCGGECQSEIRDTQDQIAERYSMVDIMSTTGVVGHDGCHFSYEGYLEFAHRIFPLVSRDFYGSVNNISISPPKLINITAKQGNEIILKFDQPITIELKKEVNGKVHFLKDQFFFRTDKNQEYNLVKVKKIEASKNQIILKLQNKVGQDPLTYLPNKYYLNTEDVYNGPWIRGAENNLGALTFDRRNKKNK